MPCNPKKVMDNIVAMLNSDIDDIEMYMFEIKDNLSTCAVGGIKSSKPKIKRPPSAYNKYMSVCIKGKKGQSDHKTNFKACVAEWKVVKNNGN